MIPETVQKYTQTKCFETFDEKYPDMSSDSLLPQLNRDSHLENKIFKQLFNFVRGCSKP